MLLVLFPRCSAAPPTLGPPTPSWTCLRARRCSRSPLSQWLSQTPTLRHSWSVLQAGFSLKVCTAKVLMPLCSAPLCCLQPHKAHCAAQQRSTVLRVLVSFCLECPCWHAAPLVASVTHAPLATHSHASWQEPEVKHTAGPPH
jgi:hypothetical protein